MKQVAVCVPVYNGATYLEATLATLVEQTCPDIRVLLSVEPGTDDSARLCQALAREYQDIEVVLQSKRLGFAGHVDVLLRHTDAPFVCITPQDDLLEPDCIAALLAALDDNPDAVLAYADMDRGPGSPVEFQASLGGSPVERAVGFLARQINHVEWRGLIRASAVNGVRDLRRTPVIDQSLPCQLAVEGELVRVPRTLYHKRIHPASGTAIQRDSPAGNLDRVRDTLTSWRDCTRLMLGDPRLGDSVDWLRVASLLRLVVICEREAPLHAEPVWSPGIDSLPFFTVAERVELLALADATLQRLARNRRQQPVVWDILDCELRLLAAITAEYFQEHLLTEDILGSRACCREMLQLDPFHASAMQRLLASGRSD